MSARWRRCSPEDAVADFDYDAAGGEHALFEIGAPDGGRKSARWISRLTGMAEVGESVGWTVGIICAFEGGVSVKG